MLDVRRREFITLLGGAAAWPLAARAQQSAKIARIGFLGTTMPSGLETTGVLPRFRTGLRDLGYIEGQNILIDFRWAEGNYARLAEFAAELVRLKVDLLMTHGTPGTLAAKRVTTTVPIVWPLRRPDELQSVASRAAKTGVDATAVTSDPIFVSNARRIAEITANNGFLQSASLNSRKLAA